MPRPSRRRKRQHDVVARGRFSANRAVINARARAPSPKESHWSSSKNCGSAADRGSSSLSNRRRCSSCGVTSKRVIRSGPRVRTALRAGARSSERVVLRPASRCPGMVSRSWTHWATSRDLTDLMVPAHDAGTGLFGRDLGETQRGGPFVLDPFDAYAAGLLSNPNVVVAGSIGAGKSTVVKMMLDACAARTWPTSGHSRPERASTRRWRTRTVSPPSRSDVTVGVVLSRKTTARAGTSCARSSPVPRARR